MFYRKILFGICLSLLLLLPYVAASHCDKTIPCKQLAIIERYLHRPSATLASFEHIIDARLAFYATQGKADCHGMIASPTDTYIAIGDLQGNFEVLKKQLLELHYQKLLDENFHLKQHCYVFFLGDYTNNGPDRIEIWHTILALQYYNPTQVFILQNNHRNIDKDDEKSFRQEWTAKLSNQNISADHIDKVLKKLQALCQLFVRTVFIGLQTPSTHLYDFVIFCNKLDSGLRSVNSYMNDLITKHINTTYAYPCQEYYRHQYSSDKNPSETDDFNYRISAIIMNKQYIKSGIIQLKTDATLEKRHHKLVVTREVTPHWPISSFSIIEGSTSGHWFIKICTV